MPGFEYDVALYEDRNMRDHRIREATLAAHRFFGGVASLRYVYVPHRAFRLVGARHAVTWGSFDPSAPPAVKRTVNRRKIAAHQRRTGGSLVVMEVGFLERHAHYSVSLNDIVGFGDYSMFGVPEDVRARVPLRVSPCAPSPGGFVLLAGQVANDTQLRGIRDYDAWVEATLREIRRYTDRRVVFRPHPKSRPGSRLRTAAWAAGAGVELSAAASLEDDVRGAHCVVAYNSNALLDAVMLGRPVFCLGDGMIARGLANTDLGRIESPWCPPETLVRQTAARVSHWQWTAGEIERGLAFPFCARPERD